MPRSIGVFGAGPGLGWAVARRYAREGYEVVLVARDRQPLDVFAQDLAGIGASAHVITADLADTDLGRRKDAREAAHSPGPASATVS